MYLLIPGKTCHLICGRTLNNKLSYWLKTQYIFFLLLQQDISPAIYFLVMEGSEDKNRYGRCIEIYPHVIPSSKIQYIITSGYSFGIQIGRIVSECYVATNFTYLLHLSSSRYKFGSHISSPRNSRENCTHFYTNRKNGRMGSALNEGPAF